MTEATTLDESQSRLLGALTIASVQRLGGDAVCVDQDNRFRSWRMARVNDLVLIDQAADETGPRSINCYFAKAEEIDPASGFAEDGVRFKINPSRLLFALHWLHRGEPPDLDLTLVRDPATWYEFVADSLMNALNQHDPHMFDRLRAMSG